MKVTEAVVEHRYLFWFTCECGEQYKLEIPKGMSLEVIGYTRAICQCGKQLYFGVLNTWLLDSESE